MIQNAIEFRIAYQLSVFPVQSGGKRPIADWGQYRQQPASLSEILSWCPECNLALATGAISGVVVVDCESAEDARWFAENRCDTPLQICTPRGVHLYYRHPGTRIPNAQRVPDEQGRPRYDIRGDDGYVLLPPSTVSPRVPGVKAAGAYRFRHCDFSALAAADVFDLAWRWPDYIEKTQTSIASANSNRCPQSQRRVTDGAAYIRHIHAVSGRAGHNETFRAVCRLRESGMNENEAMDVLQEWNQTNADPPWSDRELLHKIRSVYGG